MELLLRDELPLLLVAAKAPEAEHHLSGNRAKALLDEATAIFERHDVPHSKRLARLRTLSTQFAAR